MSQSRSKQRFWEEMTGTNGTPRRFRVTWRLIIQSESKAAAQLRRRHNTNDSCVSVFDVNDANTRHSLCARKRTLFFMTSCLRVHKQKELQRPLVDTRAHCSQSAFTHNQHLRAAGPRPANTLTHVCFRCKLTSLSESEHVTTTRFKDVTPTLPLQTLGCLTPEHVRINVILTTIIMFI